MTRRQRVLALSFVLVLVESVSVVGREPTLGPSGSIRAYVEPNQSRILTDEETSYVWKSLPTAPVLPQVSPVLPEVTPIPSRVPPITPQVPPITPPKLNLSSVRGSSTWYCLAGVSRCPAGYSGGRYAAAGPALRRALGDWRGKTVFVSYAGSKPISVKLVDWCACKGDRVIDLFGDAFAKLAPRSRGVIPVTVSW